jgi:predicted nucleic acid-binding protein
MQVRYRVSRRDRERVLRRLDRSAEWVLPLVNLPLPVRDPKDERVLGTALAVNADYLETGDDDLLVLAGDPRLGDLTIVTVVAFLAILRERSDDRGTGP